MPPVESDSQATRQQLERVLASPGFARNERMSRFLRFVVERHVEGRDDELKESLIAIEVFGRPPGYDSKRDPIVRTEASRLRARLNEYYLGEGKGDSLMIELPKGGYTPVIWPVEAGHMEPEHPRPRRGLTLAAAIAGVLVTVGVASYWGLHQKAPIGIAVLPLENLSHNPSDDYLADGLTDELIRNLSIIDGLSPRSRTSSFAFKGKPRNLHEVGKELGADYIVEGSVLRAGQQLRIEAQLVRVRDDFPIWSGKFDRETTDIFAVQEEISRGIVNSLRLKLGQGRRRYETSIDAYDPYLRARAGEATAGRGNRAANIELFKQAIAKDNSFAPAYAGLAATYAYVSATFPNLDRRDDQLEEMRTAAEKAIELDPLLAEGHAALGMAYARDGNWEQSEKSFRRAIELDPSRSDSHGDFAMNLLLVLGRTNEALQQLRLAESTDPQSPQIQYSLSYGLISTARYDEAARLCEEMPADNRLRIECLGRARIGQGKIADAIEILTTVGNRGYLGYAYARAGRREDAEKVAAAVSPNPFNQALVFAGLGDRERTLDALERMSVLGPVRIGRALTFPEFGFVRSDPRVAALCKRVGLPLRKT